MTEYLYEEITREIIGAAFEIYKTLGYGFLEKVYENAMVVELKLRSLKVEQQKAIQVFYKDNVIGDYRSDLFVDDKIIIELKVEKIYNPKHEAQLIHYLKSTNLKVGLLINFGATKCHPKRMVN